MVLTLGPDDAIWFSRGDGHIGRIDPAGAVSALPTRSGSPYGLCAGPGRTIWYTLLTADRIGAITLGGEIEEYPLAAGGVSTYPLPTSDAAPVGIHGGAEAVWFTEIGAGQIRRIFPDGRIEEFPLPDRSCRPHAITATADGGGWATLWATSSVVRLDRDGHLAEEISFPAGAEPHGIALAPDGSLWVALETGFLTHLTSEP